MGYNHYQTENVSFFKKLKRKAGKLLARSAPFNAARIWGLRICGFRVGRQVYIGEGLLIVSPLSENNCHLEIGDRVAIAPRVTIVLGSDPNYSKLSKYYPPVRSTVRLEDDCWIGTGAILHPHIVIGSAAIVGSGSVVTRTVAPHTVVAGVPASMKGMTRKTKMNAVHCGWLFPPAFLYSLFI